MPEPSERSPLADSLARMAGILLSEEDLDRVLDLVVTLAVQAIPSAAAVSLSLQSGNGFVTAADTDPRARRADEAQYAEGDGPCITAARGKEPVYVPSLPDEARWNRFRAVAIDEGFSGILSYPLVADGLALGAINLYVAEAHPFDGVEHGIARVFAEHAGILIANAKAFSDANQLSNNLKRALESREAIGAAKGILMEREGVSSEEAFDILRRLSQTSNVKLRQIAERVIASTKADITSEEPDGNEGDHA